MTTNPTTARQFVVAALVFSALLAGVFSMIAVSIPSNSCNFTDFNRSMNKFSEIKDETSKIANKTKESTPAEGVEGIVSGLWSSSFGAVRQIWNSYGTMEAVITDVGEGSGAFKMPGWFTGLLITIIFITIGFALIASWRKWHI